MDWTKKVGRKQVGRKLGARLCLYCIVPVAAQVIGKPCHGREVKAGESVGLGGTVVKLPLRREGGGVQIHLRGIEMVWVTLQKLTIGIY